MGLGAALMCFASLAPAAGFEAASKLADKGFLVGAEARLLDSDETIGSLSPSMQLTPASLSKVYLAAASLDRWGPQKRFETRLVSSALVNSQGTLQGDLILDGSGDPGLTSEDYWTLVQGLKEYGIKRIDGRLLISQWRFGPVKCLTQDRCAALTSTRHAYDAQLSSAAVDFATWCARVMPSADVGQEARVMGCFGDQPLTQVRNKVKTVAAGQRTTIAAQRTTSNGVDTLVLSGQVARDTFPRTVYRGSADPAAQSAATLEDLLDREGIKVSGGSATTQLQPPSSAHIYAFVEGKPLQELLLRMMNYSNNFMADTLALDLAATTPATLASASAALERFVADSVPDHGPVTLNSGSGLTPENKTSAHGLVSLLDAMYHRPALFPVLVAGMQVPTNGPMRFIRRGSETFQSHVMIKTGTLNQPVPVRAISGYFRTKTGRWGAFAVMVNSRSASNYLQWPTVLDAVSRDMTALIEAH